MDVGENSKVLTVNHSINLKEVCFMNLYSNSNLYF